MRRFLVFILFIGLFIATSKLCHKRTDGLAIHKMRKSFTENNIEFFPLMHFSADMELVQKILKEPLQYIGRGGQCYAFTTPDNEYVVKILKYNNNYPRIWFRLFPFPFSLETYRQKVLSRKRQKLEGEYKSYQIAFDDLSSETGLIYLHLHNHSLRNTTIHIIDKLNIHHILPADNFQFYIQKKGTPLYPHFADLLRQERLEEAKAALDVISSYLVKRCEKKITDNDDGIWRNFAFYQERPFQIDIGQFHYNENLASEEAFTSDILFFTKDFRHWLEKTSPILAQHFLESIQRECLNSFNPSKESIY